MKKEQIQELPEQVENACYNYYGIELGKIACEISGEAFTCH